MGRRSRHGRRAALDVSPGLLGEHLIGRILGWEQVDWSIIERHREGRRFSFRREPCPEPAIHDQLTPLLKRCNPAIGEYAPLAPSPTVNRNLTRLIGYLCRHFGEHHLPPDTTAAGPLVRTVEQESVHAGVVGHVLGRLDADPDLAERARTLKRIAALAEGELEKHFAAAINAGIEMRFFRGNEADHTQRRRLEERARAGLEAGRRLNRDEVAGLSLPDLPDDADRDLRLEMAKLVLQSFPYVRNYELMARAEIAMLQQPLRPRFVRERLLDGDSLRSDRIRRLDRAAAALAAASGASADIGWRSALADKTIAFCGAGPLPLSGLFLHLMTGARMTLIDRDPTAIDHAARLIGNLERLEILTPGGLTVVREDAGSLRLQDDRERPSFDAVMLASLVDPDAKAALAERVAAARHGPGLIIARSARALCARLAYDPINPRHFDSFVLAYCGETLPATHVATHLNRIDAIRQDVTAPGSIDLLGVAHKSVVNSTEVYRKLPTAVAGRWSGGDAETCIQVLEQALERTTSAVPPIMPSV
ncbi:MAG: hypothetical protein R3F54_25265 [Alphaproteobacteria bacterium]